MRYKNPLLIELIAELEYSALASSDILLTGPRLLDLGFRDTEFTMAVGKALTPRIRCWQHNRTQLVQLAHGPPALVTVNQVINSAARYEGWDSFATLVGRVRKEIAEVRDVVPDFVTLHFIDELKRPVEGFALGRYFNCSGTTIPGWYADCNVPCDITLGRGLQSEDGSNRQVKLSLKRSASAFNMRLDTRFTNRLEPDQTVDDVLQQLHDEGVSLFESLITEETRGIMGRLKE